MKIKEAEEIQEDDEKDEGKMTSRTRSMKIIWSRTEIIDMRTKLSKED